MRLARRKGEAHLASAFTFLPAAILVALSAPAGCSDDVVKAGIAKGCTLNSHCQNGLVCSSGLCHEQCAQTLDCPAGQRCVQSESANVCQLAEEATCHLNSECTPPLVCAVDLQCRNECNTSVDCLEGQECAEHVCAEPNEVNADGRLIGNPNLGSGAAGAGGSGDVEAGGSPTGGTAGAGGSDSMGEGGTGEGGTLGLGGSEATAGAGGSGNPVGDGGAAGSGAGSGGCIEALFGDYMLRTDGGLLFVDDSFAQQPILLRSSGLPLSDVVEVMQGWTHGCAVRSDQTVWCWPSTPSGNNLRGELGDGTQDDAPIYRASQVLVSSGTPLTSATTVPATPGTWPDSSCAIRSDNTLWCWGNTSYLLNDGASQDSVYATQVTSNGSEPFASVLDLGLSYLFACALVDGSSANEVWCWGNNSVGQLGSGNMTPEPYPIQVTGIATPTSVAVMDETACALDGDQVRCWGYNDSGEAGVNNFTHPLYNPTLVKLQNGTALAGVTAIAGGLGDGCALRADTSLWCWGQSLQSYAAPYQIDLAPVIDVVALGTPSFSPRFLTGDGTYHIGTTAIEPNCGSLE